MQGFFIKSSIDLSVNEKQISEDRYATHLGQGSKIRSVPKPRNRVSAGTCAYRFACRHHQYCKRVWQEVLVVEQP